MTFLDSALKQNRGVGPGFHMLRHLLALVILAHHCRIAVFGVGFDDTYAKGRALTPGAMAELSYGHLAVELLRPGLFALVGLFFALSGFLVVGSAIRNPSTKVFFANRALRILPALTVEVTLSALVLGPLVTNLDLGAYFADSRFFAYFGNIVGHVTFVLPGVFTANPWPDMVNANLWTLPPEFWCYIVMLGLMLTGLLRRSRWLTVAVVLAMVVWTGFGLYDPAGFSIRGDSTHFATWYIVLMFFYGVVFFINARHVPLHPMIFLGCAAAYYVIMLTGWLEPLGGVMLTYCMVYVGFMAFPLFDRLVRTDLSYGTYLYGFPITQAVIHYLLPHLSAWPVAVRFGLILPLVVGLTALFSLASWIYIEKPALSLRRHVLRQPPRTTTPTALRHTPATPTSPGTLSSAPAPRPG